MRAMCGRRLGRLAGLGFILAGAACGAGGAGSADAGAADGSTRVTPTQAQALAAVKAYVASNLDALAGAALALQRAAPVPDPDGWSSATDQPAVDAMKAAWRQAREAYLHIDSAVEVLFPALAVSMDERYDGFVDLASDDDLFDGQGVTGLHAIERILWAGEPRPEVLAFEQGLAAYRPAAFPRTQAQAEAFARQLCARLVNDAETMRTRLPGLGLDVSAAYRGVVRALSRQSDALATAGTGEEASRYANQPLAEMRARLEGGQAVQAAFAPLLRSMPGGPALVDRIDAGLARLSAALAGGAQLPPVPGTWMAASPSAADLATPFGMLHTLLETESNPKDPASLMSALAQAAGALGVKGDAD
jgi:iron uptake system component EfeO